MSIKNFGTARLSVRERECLSLVATGLSSHEIADRMRIAPRTVEAHLNNARLKLQARNRTHMVVQALQSGEIGFAPNTSN